VFVERPGVMEFTGQLIVRPLQPSAWEALGVDGPMLAQARAEAAAALANNTVVYYPEVDEYVVTIPPGMNENTYSAQLMTTGLYQYAEPNWRCFPHRRPQRSALQSAVAPREHAIGAPRGMPRVAPGWAARASSSPSPTRASM
jgi:hypothetical protein